MKASNVLILGANSDIATATAKKFAEEGFNLQLASRDVEELEKTAANLSIRYHIDASTHYFDATDYSSHKIFFAGLAPKPDGVVVAFGTMVDQQVAQSNFGYAKNMIETNYLGVVSILEVIASDFEDRKHGFITGISSVAGERGRKSNYIYGSSKSGLTTYLQGLSHRLSHSNILVQIVKPGFVNTKMTAHLDLPNILTAEPKDVGEQIYKGIKKRKGTIYVKSIWGYIMLVVRNIPAFLFEKINL